MRNYLELMTGLTRQQAQMVAMKKELRELKEARQRHIDAYLRESRIYQARMCELTTQILQMEIDLITERKAPCEY